MTDISHSIAKLVDLLAAMPGTVAVVLGGSRASKSDDEESDWDLGLYYRGTIDLSLLSAYGTVFPPGAWGRIMNGGAWLQWEGHKVDVLLRDLDVVEYWAVRAEQGEFERDALLGYLAGIPTYTLSAELASCRPLHGQIQQRLSAETCRSGAADVAVLQVVQSGLRAHAREARQRCGAAGQAAAAMMEEAHAILCERSQWVCNEKRLVELAGLSSLHALFTTTPPERKELVKWVDLVADRLG
jgi:hypothetical protein